MRPTDVTLDALDQSHHEVIEELRQYGPVVWVDAIGGWMVLSRDLAVAVMRDAATYTVDDPRFSTAQVIGPSMLSLDGDRHHQHRSPFADAYRPSEVTSRYAGSIEEAARRLVADLRPSGRAELRRQLAGPLAVAVVAMSLGIESIGTEQLLRWYDAIVAAVDDVSRGHEVSPAGATAYSQLAGALAHATRRSDSVLHRAAQSLSEAEVASNAAVFLFGGIETSEGMTANALHHLLANPSALAAVAADRSLIDAAVEESLRLEPAATRVDRYATVDVSVGGVNVRRGDLVVVSLSAANRDPAYFDDPHQFRLDRANSRSHVAFAQGPHACIGAQLARMETRAAIAAVIDHFDDVHLDADVRLAGSIFRKPVALWAAWSPSAEIGRPT
jgi:cytochrome P450